jgi:glycosyltransferase involved in cell wall biosynthesis
MQKNVLVFNSGILSNSFVEDLFVELEEKKYFFYLVSSSSELIKDFRDKRRIVSKAYFGPEPDSKFKLFLFLLLAPFLVCYLFLLVWYLKRKLNPQAIICLHSGEKILVSSIARIFKMKIVWLEPTEINYRQLGPLVLRLLKISSRQVRVLAGTEQAGVQLKSLGFPEGNISVFFPGIKLRQPRHQENIFFDLAKTERENLNHKYFTLGTVTDYAETSQIETLFKAAKICLSLIPNLQIIILGDGKLKKQFMWAAKKIEIENIVWFVGRQDNLKKWLGNFDIFLALNEKLKPVNIKLLLKAMESSLPLVGFNGWGQEDFIHHEENGLLSEPSDSETLANNIIRLYKNRLFLHKLGERGRKMIEEKFNIEKQAQEIEKYF